MTEDTTVVRGRAYGDGTYVASASSVASVSGSASVSGGVASAYKGFNKNATFAQCWESAPGGYAGKSGPQKNGAYSDTVTTTVDGAPVPGKWLQLQLPGPIVLTSYSISPRQDGSYPLHQRNPGTRVLAGSADGATWTRLSAVTGHQWTDYDTLTLDLASMAAAPPPLICFRLIVVNVGNWGTGDHPGASINELYLTGK
ncbi:hypothetical protein FOA52_010967 [Chlamydomonas sp. UWO 241]|nr:hypothetical protein FOA52_010967 [Chlamydomonas sp. UWO 241]